MNKTVERFNQQFLVGSVVRWRPTYPSAEFQEYKVREPAYDLHGQAVAFLTGKAGCVSVEPEFLDYDYQPLSDGKSLT